METVYEETHESGAVIKIYPDFEPLNPRTDWDHEGTEMLCWHKRYSLGDKHGYAQSGSLLEELKQEREDDPRHEAAEILPLFLMDHSGITMSTSSQPFQVCDSQGWDWGQVGLMVSRPEGIRVVYQIPETEAITEDHRRRIRELLEAEVETYDQYLTGEVYGFVVETPEGEQLDSCWGFYGDPDDRYMLGEARSAAAAWGAEVAENNAMLAALEGGFDSAAQGTTV
jgi:hypothetical protein